MREAKIYYTEVVNGKKTEEYLCEKCAAKKTSFNMKPPFGDGSFSIDGILTGILGQAVQSTREGQRDDSENEKDTVCPGCGLTLDEFRESGKFGCAACYKAFAPFLEGKMKLIQVAGAHSGKVPGRYINENKNLTADDRTESTQKKEQTGRKSLTAKDRLLLKMQQAVEREDFEEAARIRDEIKKMENGGHRSKKKLASVNDKDVDKPKQKVSKRKSDGIRKEGFKKVKGSI
jgi:protein arginine kinase activator